MPRSRHSRKGQARSAYRRSRIESLERREYFSANPIITEFVASNNGSLRDGYGAASDWIEIYNAGDQPVDLAGYTLSDNPDKINRWTFPNKVLEPGQYLVVFASGQDTTDPSGAFHTNFSLSAGGEYLVLARPNGVIVSEFGSDEETYPALGANVAYGLGFDSSFTNVVTPSSAARYWIPSNNSLNTEWTSTSFDDSGWQVGEASLGYEVGTTTYAGHYSEELPNGTETVYLRVPFEVTDAAAVLGTLSLKYDDGFVAYLNGTRIASANAQGSVNFASSATEFRPQEAAIADAVFDVSGYSHLLNVGENVLAIHLLDSPDSPSEDLLVAPTLAIASGTLAATAESGQLSFATPGMPNSRVIASDVQFSRPGGAFADNFQLTLSALEGEVIRYTTDGSTPGPNSPIYSAPIAISGSTIVRARSYSSDGREGAIFASAYTKSATNDYSKRSDLPIIVIENFGAGIPGREFMDAYLTLYDIDEQTGTSGLSDEPALSTKIGQHRRGSSTYTAPKPSLRIELRDENGEDRDASLLGMPADSDFILYGDGTFDRSMIRNAVMYDLSNQSGNYAVRTRYVQVYINADGGAIDSNDYYGIYILMENIKVGESRVDIESLEPYDNAPPGVVGGYVFKQDRPDSNEDASWNTDRNQPAGVPDFVHVSPERAELTAAQVDSLRNYIQEFEDALYGPNWRNDDLGYASYIDPQSWVEHHLLRVFSGEGDAQFLSEHFAIDRDGKIHAGPIWDFNLSMGWDGSAVPDIVGPSIFNSQWYWGRLFNDPDFAQLWVDQWWEMREGVLSDSNLEATVERHADMIRSMTLANFARWAGYPARSTGAYATPGLSGWESEISHIKGWLKARAALFDFQSVMPASFSRPPGPIDPGSEVSIGHSLPGVILYYTIDGTDPRADGGVVASTAQVYDGDPIAIASTIRIKVRAFDPSKVGTDLGPWGALSDGLFSTADAASVVNLRVSEFHYNPLDPTVAELQQLSGIDNNSFEFIELVNISNRPIDLTGVEFNKGITFSFDAGDVVILAPGQSVLIVSDRNAFQLRYGAVGLIAGEYSGKLDGSGEEIALIDALGNDIIRFEYSDDSPWPEDADGDGPSLELWDLLGDPNSAASWRASATDHGTPGVAGAVLYGDYNRDGTIDQSDWQVWASQYGAKMSLPGLGADGNLDGVVNAADYAVWRDRLDGFTPPVAPAVTAAPVPAVAVPAAPVVQPPQPETAPTRRVIAHVATADVTSWQYIPNLEPIIPNDSGVGTKLEARTPDLTSRDDNSLLLLSHPQQPAAHRVWDEALLATLLGGEEKTDHASEDMLLPQLTDAVSRNSKRSEL